MIALLEEMVYLSSGRRQEREDFLKGLYDAASQRDQVSHNDYKIREAGTIGVSSW